MTYNLRVKGNITNKVGGTARTYAKEGVERSSNKSIRKFAENYTYEEPGDPPASKRPKENLIGVKVTASLFFDGTKNNRNNTFRRLDKNTQSKTNNESRVIYNKTKEEESSYENGYSNIAILEKMNISNKKNRVVSKYIEGEGTEDDQKGDSMGFGFGSGSTGIPAKVKKGFNLINIEINSVFNFKKEYVKELTLNVFGFSRGAAAARSFLTTTRTKFKNNYPKAEIKYNFVGLFDTVSSYEPKGRFGALGAAGSHNFDNDVTELGLKLNGMAKKVIHLTAADEYRANFSLTTIDSDIAAGVGYELQLPGAHSDIGGGYEDYPHIEKRRVNRDEKYIKEEWYTKEQLKGDNGEHDFINFIGTRKLTNSYQFIPFSIMMQFAKKNGISFKSFDDKKEYKNYEVIPDLQLVKKELESFALKNEAATTKIATIQDVKELKRIRNKYLHISANAYSLGMNANYKMAKLHRQIIKDNAKKS